jgi:4-hydroxybenzoate polyprenyltransferase
MSTTARYLVFVEERFPPAAYLPLIGVFAAAGYVPSVALGGVVLEPLRFAATALVIGLAFLHLRLVDEVKDADIDRVARPSRPLPRGLVTAHELTVVAVLAFVTAVLTAAAMGPHPVLALIPSAGAILLADVEFLAPRWVHRDLLRYALVHSLVVPLLMVFAWFAAPGARSAPALAGLVILAWGVGLGLEITRKAYAPDEERALVETYSSAIGQRWAGWLAAGSLGLAMSGGALYAWLAGGGPAVTVAGVVASMLIPVSAFVFGRANHRTTELVGGFIGLGILMWPIGVAIVLGGTPR